MWHRYDLTSDFAAFHQAWHQIGAGQLNPHLSTFAHNYPHYGYPFLQSHFELAMWPLALLRFISPASIDLLIVQDLALAGSGLVALRWGLELLNRYWPADRPKVGLVGAALLAVLLINPWTYWTASFDFHVQPIACLFLLLAGRDVWAGRGRAWLWVAAVLSCGDVAATYVAALGFSAILAGRRTRRTGVALIVASFAWLGLIAAVGSGKGSSLSTNYGYLVHGSVGSGLSGVLAIGTGILRSPGRALHVLEQRRSEIYKFLAGAGTLGVFSTVGIGMALVVITANALNMSPAFIGAAASFQSMAAVWFTAVGGIALVTWLVRRGRAGRWLALFLGTAALLQSLVVAVHWVPKARYFLKVNAATARELDVAGRQIPTSAEVIASQGVIGRFGGRQWVYPFLDSFGDGQTVPVEAQVVAFVFTPDAGIEAASPDQTRTAIARVRDQLHAQVLVEKSGVYAFLWHPSSNTKSINFPLAVGP
jgi:hypothetical protein